MLLGPLLSASFNNSSGQMHGYGEPPQRSTRGHGLPQGRFPGSVRTFKGGRERGMYVGGADEYDECGHRGAL